MAEEIQQAVEIIRVVYDGVEIAFKIGSGGMEAAQKALKVLTALLDHEKSLGKTSMRKLLLRGGDLQVLQFQDKDLKKVKRLAKKYGILYSVLPDTNKKDGLCEVIFHTEAVPRANMLLKRLKSGRIATFDDYLKGGDEKQINKLLDFLNKQKRGNEKLHTDESFRAGEAIDGLIEKVGMFAAGKQKISVEAIKENFCIGDSQAETVLNQLETIGFLDKRDDNGFHKVLMDKNAFANRLRRYQELANRIRAVSASKNPELSDITISKTLIKEENAHAVKTRVPGTWGSQTRYVWMDKENVMDINHGKTMLTFINEKKQYKLYDSENRVVSTISGGELYSHYDKVSHEVRKRYDEKKVQSKTKKAETAVKRR